MDDSLTPLLLGLGISGFDCDRYHNRVGKKK